MEKYFNDAIIGNQNITASYSKKGEALSLLYPAANYKQVIEFYHVGLKINDSGMVYLHQDINNVYKQYYTEGTNILNTEIVNTYFNLKIIQTDFASIKENIIVKRYKFINESAINLNMDFLIHSSLVSTQNNKVSGLCKNDTLMQYNNDFIVSTFSKQKIKSSQINNVEANIEEGQIEDKAYIGMSKDSGISYEIGIIKPGEIKEFDIIIYVEENKIGLSELEKNIERIKKIDFKTEEENVKKYWIKYLREHDGLTLDLAETPKNRRVEEIYERTILLFPLLINKESGGISAAIEVDEDLRNSANYNYCWIRNAMFMINAMDILKMGKDADRFYKVFCKNTQSRDGMWEQRFFSDGRLAPCWGYEIDETASVIYGVYNHYKITKDKKFLKDNLKMCEKALKYLEKYILDVIEENGRFPASYDLWELHEGIHLYSIASIFASFDSMMKIYEELKDEFTKNRVKQEDVNKKKDELRKELVKIREFVLQNFYDDTKKSFVRNLEDKKLDISVIGAVIQFNIFTPKEKKILNTVERINMTLRTYTGAYTRFERDSYKDGNPWVVTTLWMANYYAEIGEKAKAKECFDLVTKTSSKHGFLGEQINNEKMEPAGAIGFGWSHAMYIIVLKKLIEKGIIK
jgi:oligosaccharide amylase